MTDPIEAARRELENLAEHLEDSQHGECDDPGDSHESDDRIVIARALLEAEEAAEVWRRDYRAASASWARDAAQLQARAEKAEAEVERLNSRIRGLEDGQMMAASQVREWKATALTALDQRDALAKALREMVDYGSRLGWESHLNGCTDTADGSLDCICDDPFQTARAALASLGAEGVEQGNKTPEERVRTAEETKAMLDHIADLWGKSKRRTR